MCRADEAMCRGDDEMCRADGEMCRGDDEMCRGEGIENSRAIGENSIGGGIKIVELTEKIIELYPKSGWKSAKTSNIQSSKTNSSHGIK